MAKPKRIAVVFLVTRVIPALVHVVPWTAGPRVSLGGSGGLTSAPAAYLTYVDAGGAVGSAPAGRGWAAGGSPGGGGGSPGGGGTSGPPPPFARRSANGAYAFPGEVSGGGCLRDAFCLTPSRCGP